MKLKVYVPKYSSDVFNKDNIFPGDNYTMMLYLYVNDLLIYYR